MAGFFAYGEAFAGLLLLALAEGGAEGGGDGVSVDFVGWVAGGVMA